MTKLSGETFSMMQTPKPELPTLFSVQKLCLWTCRRPLKIRGLWHLYDVQLLELQKCTKLHVFEHKISKKNFRGIIPRTPMWEWRFSASMSGGRAPTLAFFWLRACSTSESVWIDLVYKTNKIEIFACLTDPFLSHYHEYKTSTVLPRRGTSLLKCCCDLLAYDVR